MMEWIDHDGLDYPDLPPKTLIKVRFHDGIGDHWAAEEWEFWESGDEDPVDHWLRSGAQNINNLIVSYQVQE